jgi:hypothetical protein
VLDKKLERIMPWMASIGATAGGPALPADLDEPTGEKW